MSRQQTYQDLSITRMPVEDLVHTVKSMKSRRSVKYWQDSEEECSLCGSNKGPTILLEGGKF